MRSALPIAALSILFAAQAGAQDLDLRDKTIVIDAKPTRYHYIAPNGRIYSAENNHAHKGKSGNEYQLGQTISFRNPMDRCMTIAKKTHAAISGNVLTLSVLESKTVTPQGCPLPGTIAGDPSAEKIEISGADCVATSIFGGKVVATDRTCRVVSGRQIPKYVAR
jgi:hypothetical protein